VEKNFQGALTPLPLTPGETDKTKCRAIISAPLWEWRIKAFFKTIGSLYPFRCGETNPFDCFDYFKVILLQISGEYRFMVRDPVPQPFYIVQPLE
jgi:hypothetical protein